MEISGWDYTFIGIARLIAKHSTCIRINVGVIIVKDGRILSTGYNGVPSGADHCNDIFSKEDMNDKDFKIKHQEFSDSNEVHGEMNAIIYAAKHGISIDNGIMYTTHSPCSNCAKAVISSGIKKVVYDIPYDRDMNGIDILKKYGVEAININKGITTYPYVCKMCGRQSYETQFDVDEFDFCICRKGYGCQK